MIEWDSYFMELARVTSLRSKDPSTKVGAVIVDGHRRIVSAGYNGFARGVKDTPERLADRNIKLPLTIHAELNALLYAQRGLTGCCIYVWPFEPCAACASAIAQSGIARVVAPVADEELFARWKDSILLAREVFKDARIKLVEWSDEDSRQAALDLVLPTHVAPRFAPGGITTNASEVVWDSGLD